MRQGLVDAAQQGHLTIPTNGGPLSNLKPTEKKLHKKESFQKTKRSVSMQDADADAVP